MPRTRSPRVVSLVPSVTESLLAWGIEPVACTRFCEQPALRHVGGTKDPDIAAIVHLDPDVVVVDREENRREDHEALVAAGVETLVLHVTSLEDVAGALDQLGQCLGVEASQLRLPPRRTAARTAFVPIWRRPWMSIGPPTYGGSLLAHLGVRVSGDPGVPYTTHGDDGLAALDVDLVIAPSEPYPFTDRHVPELEAVAPVALVDGQDLFWWGVRTSDALSRLATALDLD